MGSLAAAVCLDVFVRLHVMESGTANSQRKDYNVFLVDRTRYGEPGLSLMISFLPGERAFKEGMQPLAIVGRWRFEPGHLWWVKDTPRDVNQLAPMAFRRPELFQENEPFARLLHHTIASCPPPEEDVREALARPHTGCDVAIFDTRDPHAGPKDMVSECFGFFRVENGRLVPDPYRRNLLHRLLTAKGLFRLPTRLHSALTERIEALIAKERKGLDGATGGL